MAIAAIYTERASGKIIGVAIRISVDVVGVDTNVAFRIICPPIACRAIIAAGSHAVIVIVSIPHRLAVSIICAELTVVLPIIFTVLPHN